MFSASRKTAIWAAEHITRDGLARARKVRRTDAFHEEASLPAAIRVRPDEFKHSCFDRGHLIPSANAQTPSSQYSTFSMANMTPQSPGSNQGIWEGIESATRDLARARGELYVVTGPIYLGAKRELLASRIAVPTHYFKAIMDPATGEGAAYISANASAQRYDVVSIAALTRLSGVEPFPNMTQSARSRPMQLLPPRVSPFEPRDVGPSCARNPDGTPAAGTTTMQSVVDSMSQSIPKLSGLKSQLVRALR